MYFDIEIDRYSCKMETIRTPASNVGMSMIYADHEGDVESNNADGVL